MLSPATAPAVNLCASTTRAVTTHVLHRNEMQNLASRLSGVQVTDFTGSPSSTSHKQFIQRRDVSLDGLFCFVSFPFTAAL